MCTAYVQSPRIPIRTGTKVFVKASLDGTHQGSIFGRGVVTNLEITGQVEGYVTATVTIKADGQLYLPNDLQGTFGGLQSLTHTTTGTTTTYTSTSLHNKAVITPLTGGKHRHLRLLSLS